MDTHTHTHTDATKRITSPATRLTKIEYKQHATVPWHDSIAILYYEARVAKRVKLQCHPQVCLLH